VLSIVLILVLGALGLLVTALITAQSLWAWTSIGLSVVAALLLVADVARRRAARRAGIEREGGDGGEPVVAGSPDEEASDLADAEVVSGLDIDVEVVDEYPRYHLADCDWLSGRETITISVREARELGFTPCARCAPDSHLAARHRASA
jgi:hypothetical protein